MKSTNPENNNQDDLLRRKSLNIYIRKSNETLGPFDKETVEEKLNRGEFQMENLACLHGDKTWSTLEEVLSGLNKNDEMFSYVNSDKYTKNRFASKVDKIVVSLTGILTIFFGGLIPLIIATIAYLLFNKKQGGWLVFISTYFLSSAWIWIIVEMYM